MKKWIAGYVATVILLCFVIVFQKMSYNKLVVKYNITIEENSTIKKALENPKVIIKPKIVYRETIKNVPVEIDITDIETIKSYEGYIKELEGQLEEISKNNPEIISIPYETVREIYIDRGSESVPIIHEISKPIKNKNWTGLLEIKGGRGVNIGLAHTLYKEASIGGSVNSRGDIGVLGLIRW